MCWLDLDTSVSLDVFFELLGSASSIIPKSFLDLLKTVKEHAVQAASVPELRLAKYYFPMSARYKEKLARELADPDVQLALRHGMPAARFILDHGPC